MNANRTLVCCWWLGIVFIAALLKWYYSMAAAMDIQWLLNPLAWLTQSVSGLQFHITPDGEWLNGELNIAIAKQCAGVNFMILSLAVYAQRFQPTAAHRSSPASLLFSAGYHIILCLSCAWAATLIVNTVRIVIAIKLYQHAVIFAGLSQAQLHRTAGVLIYLPALWLQLRMVNGIRTGAAGLLAVMLYLGIVIALPLADGNYRTDARLFGEHALFTTGIALLLLALYPFCRSVRYLLTGQVRHLRHRYWVKPG